MYGYILALALVTLPLYSAVVVLVRIMAYYYEHISFMLSLPFP